MLRVFFERAHLVLALEQLGVDHADGNKHDVAERFREQPENRQQTVNAQPRVAADEDDGGRLLWIKFRHYLAGFSRDIFEGFYGWASLQKKPIMVGEFGVQERNPGDKAQWIIDAREAIKHDFPLMRAVLYFDSDKDYDWRLTTSDSAIEAFKQMANDPWFNLGVNRRLPN